MLDAKLTIIALQGATAALAGFNVSVNLHRRAIERVMRAPMSMFDTTPLGRIMNRFSKDMDTIDNTLVRLNFRGEFSEDSD